MIRIIRSKTIKNIYKILIAKTLTIMITLHHSEINSSKNSIFFRFVKLFFKASGLCCPFCSKLPKGSKIFLFCFWEEISFQYLGIPKIGNYLLRSFLFVEISVPLKIKRFRSENSQFIHSWERKKVLQGEMKFERYPLETSEKWKIFLIVSKINAFINSYVNFLNA